MVPYLGWGGSLNVCIIITTESNVVFWTAATSDPLGCVRQRVPRLIQSQFSPETDPLKSVSCFIVIAHRKLSNSLWF